MNEHDEAFERVARAITEIAGGPELLENPITVHCRFFDDLALESVDLVTLAAMLSEESEGRVNLAAHLSELTLDDVVGLTVGRLADLIVADLRTAGAGWR